MIRVLIADDHPVFRSGLKQIINTEKNMKITGEAGTGIELMNLLKTESFDVVITDISMPGRSGLELVEEIHQHYPALPVIVLSMYTEEQYGVRSIVSGAAGYLTKKMAATNIREAVSTVVRENRKYITPVIAEKLVEKINGADSALHERLSNRELQVMRMIAAGKRLTDIGDELNLSVKTISTYRTRILEKMGFSSNAEIARYAEQHKM